MRRIFFIFLSVIIYHTPACADWINLTGAENAPTIAEIYIEDDHVRVDLEIFISDMVAFDRLIPDSFFQGSDIERPVLETRMKQFAEEDFQVVADGKKKLKAILKISEPRYRKERPSPYAGKINPYTLQRIPGPPEDKRVLYVELIYPFDSRPASLTIVPPLEENNVSKVPIGFITYHKMVPANDFRYLSEPATIALDWQDPWYSKFDNKSMKRWQRGGVMSFVYIEPYEVRHEILARVKDLEAWIDIDLRGKDFIEADENEPLKKKVGEFFIAREKLLIDGKQLTPILDRTSFIKYTQTRTFFIDQPERLPINTAVVGIIITYLTDGMPQEVTNTWDLWSNRIQRVPADAIDPAGPFPSYLTQDNNVLTWTNFLKKYKIPTVARIEIDKSMTTMAVPMATLLCLAGLIIVVVRILNRRRKGKKVRLHMGLAVLIFIAGGALYPVLKLPVGKPAVMAPEISSEEAEVVLNSLLNNIYRSFDFREENAVYDRLATSVSGDLLTDIYLQNRNSLVVTQAGGARARVKEVDVLEVEVEPLPGTPLGLRFHARWTAMGTVGHWGHIHTRKNEYMAYISVAPVDGAWKIIALDLLEEKRIDNQQAPTAN